MTTDQHDIDRLRGLAEAATQIQTEILTDARYCMGPYSTCTLSKENDAFIKALTPAVVLHMAGLLEDYKALSSKMAEQLAILQASIAELTAHLNKANSQTEEFERKWYLATDEIAELRQSNEELALKAARPGLTVWYGAMPESNGKSNFTAILYREGAIHEGHTIDRSEYPDRVRYEADRVRYLLGELTERPFILDYDANKHSGYAPPPEPKGAEQEKGHD